MNILRPSNNYVAGIFFPIGEPRFGGTCQYASERCLKECYALNKHYDVTVDIPEDDKREIYKFIVKESTLTVCNTIIKEMEGLQAKILTWFCSGDCPDSDIERIYQVMLLLNEQGVIQNGFTRNTQLYGRIIDDGIIKHIILTVESQSVDDAPEDEYPMGIWAIPDYDKGIIKLYHGTLAHREDIGNCGWHQVRETKFKGKEIVIATNCYGCYKKGIGCFTNLPSEVS